MLGGISIWQLLIVLVIVILLFGTKKLKGLGSDLGSAVKGFKKAVTDKDADFEEPQSVENKAEKTEAAGAADLEHTANKAEQKEQS